MRTWHANVTITLNIYAHVRAQDDEQAAGMVGAAIYGSSSEPLRM